MEIIELSTSKKEEILDLTHKIEAIISKSGVNNGICVIYSPHTTAGITVNENADPDVKDDILLSLNNIVKELDFKHSEGNSSAHMKTILVGKSQTLIIESGSIALGTWDGIYFCEFDGPRRRKVFVEVVEK